MVKKINYQSDFKLEVTLTLGGVAMPVPDHDFALVFSSCDGIRKYVCKRIGDVWTNCRLSDDGEKVLCFLDNHGLSVGDLRVKYIDIAPDSEMPDKDLRTVTPTTLDVELVAGAGDGATDIDVDVPTDLLAIIADINELEERCGTYIVEMEEMEAETRRYRDSARQSADTAQEAKAASLEAVMSSEANASAAITAKDNAEDSAQQADAAASSAQRSASSAADSATSASDSRLASEQAAQRASNSAANADSSEYDARRYANQASASADSARGSAEVAYSRSVNAANSAAIAAEKATIAQGGAVDAETSSEAAAASASAASGSATSASNSATAAAASATEAASVATTTATTVATNVATTIAGGKADKVVRVDKTSDPATSFTIDANKVYDFGERVSLEISLAAYAGDDVPIWAFTFVSAETATSLDIPATWEILNGSLDIEAGFTYEFNISNGLCAYGKFKTT